MMYGVGLRSTVTRSISGIITKKYKMGLVALPAASVSLMIVLASGPLFLSNHHPLPVGPAGSISWALLAQARDVDFTPDQHYIPRHYPDAVKKIAGSEILIKGYMIAIRPNGTFSDFLLVPFPPTCPYCVPVGPSQIIEEHTSKPVAFSFEPVVIRGVLKLREDDVSNLFYSMVNSEIVME